MNALVPCQCWASWLHQAPALDISDHTLAGLSARIFWPRSYSFACRAVLLSFFLCQYHRRAFARIPSRTRCIPMTKCHRVLDYKEFPKMVRSYFNQFPISLTFSLLVESPGLHMQHYHNKCYLIYACWSLDQLELVLIYTL